MSKLKKFVQGLGTPYAWLWVWFCIWTAIPIAAQDLAKKTQDSLRAVRVEKLAIFRQAHPGITTSIDETTGAPYQLLGDLSMGLKNTDPVDASYEFFVSNRNLYGITDPQSELRVVSVKSHSPKVGGGTLVQLEQFYNGVKVTRGHFKVSFNSLGELIGVVGVFSPNIDIPTTPTIDSLSAIDVARKDLKQQAKNVERMGGGSGNLSVLSHERKYHLAWIVNLMDTIMVLENWEYFIDAHSGEILSKRNRVVPDLLKAPKDPSQHQNKKDSSSSTNPQLDLKKPSFTPTETKKEPTLPLDTTRTPREIPDSSDSSRVSSPSGRDRPKSFQSERQNESRNSTIKQGKIEPAYFRLNRPIDSITKWQGREPDREKKQSFADKASKVKHSVNCPVCGGTVQAVLYVRSAKADSGAWKFRQRVVQVCKCNHAEIYG